jgi:hypothetical protein
MSKFVEVPINREKIQKCIDLYEERYKTGRLLTEEENIEFYSQLNKLWGEICPGSSVWAAHIMQPMRWCGTLDVDHVCNAIIAMGINVREVYDD